MSNDLITSRHKLAVTLVRSAIAALPNHKACLRGLGLRRVRQTVVLDNTAAIWGMINKVQHLVSVSQRDI